MTPEQLDHILQHGVKSGNFLRVGTKDGLPAYMLTSKGKERAEALIAKLMRER